MSREDLILAKKELDDVRNNIHQTRYYHYEIGEAFGDNMRRLDILLSREYISQEEERFLLDQYEMVNYLRKKEELSHSFYEEEFKRQESKLEESIEMMEKDDDVKEEEENVRD